MLLLSLSSDVALNPGPDSINSSQASMNETKYPCGYCAREVTLSNVMSLMCDNWSGIMQTARGLVIQHSIFWDSQRPHGIVTCVSFQITLMVFSNL